MALDGNFTYRDKNGEWKHILSSENLAKSIVDTINYYKNLASEYREEANKTHYEVMEEVRDEMHRKDEEFNEGFSISFVGTGVGMIYKVKCNNCGEEEDITDFESW